MIIPIILILLFLILIIAAFMNNSNDSGNFLIAAFLMLVPLVISIMTHTSQLALLRKGNDLIVIREQAIKDIDTQLLQIKVSNSSLLMNADSPIRSLVETRTKFISELTEQKIKIQEAKISIESRSIGLMKMVVWIYGKE